MKKMSLRQKKSVKKSEFKDVITLHTMIVFDDFTSKLFNDEILCCSTNEIENFYQVESDFPFFWASILPISHLVESVSFEKFAEEIKHAIQNRKKVDTILDFSNKEKKLFNALEESRLFDKNITHISFPRICGIIEYENLRVIVSRVTLLTRLTRPKICSETFKKLISAKVSHLSELHQVPHVFAVAASLMLERNLYFAINVNPLNNTENPLNPDTFEIVVSTTFRNKQSEECEKTFRIKNQPKK